MSQAEDFQQLRVDIEKTRMEYLFTDADLALTFVAMAKDAFADESKRARLREKAIRAYSDIVRLAKKVRADEPLLEQLRNKLQVVRSALKELGESSFADDVR